LELINVLVFSFLFFFVFWDSVSRCSSGWPWIHNSAASTSLVLGLQKASPWLARLYSNFCYGKTVVSLFLEVHLAPAWTTDNLPHFNFLVVHPCSSLMI
jgi:hypothetical protein